MGTKSESMPPSSVELVLHDLRRMEELEAQSRTCGHVVMLFCQIGVMRTRGNL
jgi:hypothetical protein